VVAVKIRIMGLPADVWCAVNALTDADSLDLLEVSDPYPNRGDSRMIRVYIDAQPHTGNPAGSRTWDEMKAQLFVGREEDLRTAEAHLRADIHAHRGHRHRPDDENQAR
jgi:hypothetical protein